MYKYVISVIVIGMISLSATAKPLKTFTFSKNANDSVNLWEINTLESNSTIQAILDSPATIVVFNKHYRAQNSLKSDPIRVNCNGRPRIVNAGASFACELPANGTFLVSLESDFQKNGAEGVFLFMNN